MTDLIFIATLIAFFALMVVFVRFCERIVGKEDVTGPDPAAELDADADAESGVVTPEEVPA